MFTKTKFNRIKEAYTAREKELREKGISTDRLIVSDRPPFGVFTNPGINI